MLLLQFNYFNLNAQWHYNTDPRAEFQFINNQLYIDLEADFGAHPNDNQDDSWAILKLSKYLQNLWNANGEPTTTPNIDYSQYKVKIKIPGGIYNVGKQVPLFDQSGTPISYNGGTVHGIKCSNQITTSFTSYYPEYDCHRFQDAIKYSEIFNGVPASNQEGIWVRTSDAVNTPCGYVITPYAESVELFQIIKGNLSPQYQPNGIFFMGNDPSNPPIFKYSDNMVIGCADENKTSINVTLGHYIQYYCVEPSLFDFRNVSNIQIDDIVVDGNNTSKYYLGTNIPDGFQIAGHGALFRTTKNVTLTNFIANNMGMDGLVIQDFDNTTPTNFSGSNIHIDYARRNGLSLLGGRTVNINNNSSFDHSGQATSTLPIPQTTIRSLPSSGLDIEPDREANSSCTSIISNSVTWDIHFMNCSFIDNHGYAIVNDLYSCNSAAVSAQTTNFTDDISFTGCTVFSKDDYGIMVTGKKIKFNSCTIAGTIIGGYGNYVFTPGDETIYHNCNIEDMYNGQVCTQTSSWLVETETSKGTTFDQCHFKISSNHKNFMEFATKDYTTNNYSEYCKIRDCDFLYDNVTALFKWTLISGVVFEGQNSVSSNLNINIPHSFQTQKVMFRGTNSSCTIPGSFTISGNVLHDAFPYQSPALWLGLNANNFASNDGLFEYRVKNHAMLYLNADVFYHDINGDRSKLVIENSGSLVSYWTGEIDNHGQIVAKPFSNFCLGTSYINHLSPTALLYIDPQCNLGVAAPPYNYTLNCNNPLAGYGSGVPFQCIYGDHSQVPIGFKCNPDWHNISEEGSFSILYNYSNANCSNSPNGSITFMAAGGVTPYAYSINGSAISSSPINNLPGGIYTLTATDALGCTASAEITLTAPPLITLTLSNSGIGCIGGTSTITATASGGTGTLTYSLNGGTYQSSGTFSNNVAASYTVTVKDANNCTTSSTIAITSPSTLTVSLGSTTIGCNGGTSTISATTSGGTTPYNYSLNGGTSQTANTFNNIVAGTYTIVVQDANGCTASASIVVSQPGVLTLLLSNTPIPCSGGTSTITATAGGGTPAYQYKLNSGPFQPSPIFVGNLAGTYTITVQDANACTAASTITVNPSNPVQFTSLNYFNVDCAGNPGKIISTASGGIGTITYSILPNIGTQTPAGTFNGLTPNTYTVTAADVNGCSAQTTVIINAPSSGHCCNANAVSIIANTPNLVLVNSITASTLSTTYNSSNAIFTNRVLFMDGVFTVDQSITFSSSILWFTPGGSIHLNNVSTPSITFTSNNSTLQAACDWWGGIGAYNAANRIEIKNNTHFKNALWGIHAYNDAILEAWDSHFEDNGSECILIANSSATWYFGNILNNVFTTAQNLPLPYTRTQTAIRIQDVVQIHIGGVGPGNVNMGNHFENMACGIFVINTTNTLNSQVHIKNNSFSNIHNIPATGPTPEYDKLNNCYTTEKGAAIMAYYGGPPALNTSELLVYNNFPVSSNIAFTDCDKGIVTKQAALYAENLYMDNVPMAIMNNNIMPFSTNPSSGGDNTYTIKNNKLLNTFLGIQCVGVPGAGEIKGNTIECNYGNGAINTTPMGMGTQYTYAKGIETSYFLNIPGGNFEIGGTLNNSSNANHISIPGYGGLGINVGNAGTGVAVKGNTVDLNWVGANNLACTNASQLAGIQSSNSIGVRLHNNTIHGHTAGSLPANDIQSRVDACGILLDHGDQQAVGCNYMQNTRFGILGWNANNTSTGNDLKVQGNTVDGADVGWVFRHLSNEGTLGNVGNLSNENSNQFTSLNTSIKVFKFCLNQTGDKIYTNVFPQPQSISEHMIWGTNICPYLIQQPNAGAVVFAVPGDCGALNILPESGDIPIDEALSIATDTKVYAEFPALGHWYDSKRLFDYLSDNDSIRNAFPVLVNFYNTILNNAIATERNADGKLRELIEDFANYSPTQLEGQLEDAGDENEDIDISEIQDENEQRINGIYLRMVRWGMDSLLEDDKEFIHLLAPQCPYIGGSAVYKARTLNYIIEPGAMYDDMKACNAVGVYKAGNSSSSNGQNLIQLENDLLANIKPELEKIKLKEPGDFIVYPNPANELITVRYMVIGESRLEIMDVTGRIVKVVNLPIDQERIQINISNLSVGVYTYKVFTNSIMINDGKIRKQ